MDNLTLDNIDRNFSPELLTLMGEWLTFTMIAPEMGLMQDEVLTIRDFFKKGIIGANGAFTDNLIEYGPPNGRKSIYHERLLEAYGVTQKFYNGTPNYPHIKPIVRYDDVRQTFRKNLYIDDKPIFPSFAFLSRGCLPTCEDTSFSCDAGCYPLIKALCNEGYMAQSEEMFFWTPKVRPIMEFLGAWKSIKVLRHEAQEAKKENNRLAEIGRIYRIAFNESLSRESFAPIIDYINDSDRAVLPIGAAWNIHLLPSALGADSIHEALTKLQGQKFLDILRMFEPSESDFKLRNYSSNDYKLAWHGEPV